MVGRSTSINAHLLECLSRTYSHRTYPSIHPFVLYLRKVGNSKKTQFLACQESCVTAHVNAYGLYKVFQ